ncbi:MAG TPA: hypothetical protein VN948_14475 [Terriglobales bacterium]|nr:hypothetical protein [Terriglobales bacterium]
MIGPRPQWEFGFPILRQCAYVHRSMKEFRITFLAKVVAHAVHDRDSMGISTQNLNLRFRMDFSFLDDRKVKPASLTHQEAFNHVVTVKS